MDPLWQSQPATTGTFTISAQPSATLYYELRGRSDSPRKVVLLMGAFATLRHFDQLADTLASNYDCQVLTYDHRGIGKSVPSSITNQTSDLLAADALALLLHIWGIGHKFHVLGASMGGMIAQKLAILLLRQQNPQLASMYLNVTARSMSWFTRYIPASFYSFVLPLALPLSNRRDMIASLLPKIFPKDYLDQLHSNGSTMRELWLKRWIEEYDEWWSFGDLAATANQSTVAGSHYLSDAECNIATQDDIMPSADQFILADLLKAEKRVSNSGHLGSIADFSDYCESVAVFINSNQ
ncbi:hypothetical protein HDU79_005390 [Rhizoclosmatium sp. JEL0117]|nr:hypothetical protein HDU79_005390 [Rhizoclosmatium sp. JEL0117]